MLSFLVKQPLPKVTGTANINWVTINNVSNQECTQKNISKLSNTQTIKCSIRTIVCFTMQI